MATARFRTGLFAALVAFAGLFALTGNSEAAVVNVHLDARPAWVKVAPGVKMHAWTFNGKAPGPVIRATEGDTVRVTLRNSHKGKHIHCKGLKRAKLKKCKERKRRHQSMWHAVDFHAAKIAPNVAFRNVAPGKKFTFKFKADTPGVYMYHCATGPMLEHIGMGMHGMIVIDPATPRPPAREIFLVQSEYYGKLKSGILHPSYHAMRTAAPKFVTFNGRAMRYAEKPIKVKAGQPIRVYFVDSGPSLFSAFHVVGTIFDSFEHDGIPGEAIHDVSTQVIAPGGGGIFEMVLPEPGQYPFVTHAVIDMDRGAMGLFDAS